MSGRVWIVPVGEQPGAIVGPLATMARSGDALHFLASRATVEYCERITTVLASRGCMFTPRPRTTLLAPTEIRADVVLKESGAPVGSRAHVILLANGGPKEWLFPILEVLRSDGHSHEVVFSQGACGTRALALPSGKWKVEHQPVAQLSMEELLSLLGLTWNTDSRVLAGANGAELQLTLLEAYHNQLYAHVHAATHSSSAQEHRRAALGRKALALLGLEPRRVIVTGFTSIEDGHPRQLQRAGVTIATAARAEAATGSFYSRARLGRTLARRGGNLSTVTRGTHLEDVVGVLPIGSKSGGVIKQIAALFDRGASSLLILADGADPQVVDHVALVGSLLSRWSSIVGAGARDVWPFRVLWVQRDARTGMDTWKRADPSVPHVVPDELEAAFRTELRGIQKVIVHLKPADKYLSWATWQALQQLADEQKLLVDSAYELSALNAPLIEQMKLQSGVANVDSTPLKGVRDVAGLPLDDLDRWLWQEALRAFGALGQRKPQPVCDALRRTPKYAAWRARNGLGKVDLEKDKAGDLLEHVLQVRLRMALSNAKSGILFDVQSADHQIDAVTAQAGTFVAWEAKCSPYKPKPAWRTTLTKAHRYTTCAPDRTHAVVVVPSIPPSISGHHVDEWGIHHIDFRVLGNEEALRTLATTGSLCGTNL